MDDDWDLHAVVRGCAAALRSTTPPPAPTTTPPPTFPLNSPFQGLDEIYQELAHHPPPPPAAAVMPIPAGQYQEMAPALMQRFPAAIPQHIRPRRRKNQQNKLVRQMTQEELSADSWAWRKYGQKPIKGSPYPRNYYRCSTSKGCAARKQVERSPNDAGIFVVSYTGEHTHARPTHRSSLSGSTRTKFVARNNNPLAASSSSSSASGLCQATPGLTQNDDVEEAGDDENPLPNALLNDDDDDIFRGFQDSDHDQSNGDGGDFFSGGLLSSPPWSPGNAAGGGGC